MIKVSNEEYKCAYKEVYIIINSLEEDVRECIPEEKINFYKENMDENHEFIIDYDKNINEQQILYVTKCILANLFRDYVATEEDKLEIIEKEKNELKIVEEEKKKKYNPNDIFGNNDSIKTEIRVENIDFNDEENNENDQLLILVRREESILEKIKKMLKKFFNVN